MGCSVLFLRREQKSIESGIARPVWSNDSLPRDQNQRKAVFGHLNVQVLGFDGQYRPSFINKKIGFKEAEKLMATMDDGEGTVRPSSKGTDQLTVTWKVADDMCQHVDFCEGVRGTRSASANLSPIPRKGL